MSLQTLPNTAQGVLSFFFGYIKYLASIPAILLHALCLFLGICGIFYLVFTSFPGSGDALIVTVMGWFDVEHVSWSGNPVPGILTAYFILGLVLDIGAWILRNVFNIKWGWNRKKTLRLLTIFSGINCALMALALAQEGRSDFGVPMFILFFITLFATLFALAVGKTFEAIEKGAITISIKKG